MDAVTRWADRVQAASAVGGVDGYLEALRRSGAYGRIMRALAAADTLKIAFVGETIIDEYRYVQALGKSSKEFTIATVETGREEFVGGVVAASQHGEWAKSSLVTPAASIRKTRFVDSDFNRKLFEVYGSRAVELHPVMRGEYDRKLAEATEVADVVVVTDFGHGLIGNEQRALIERQSKFLAVNAQTNAGNHGYNPITKWARADFICIDEPEARLALGMRDQTNWQVAGALYNRMASPVLVTHGRHGSYYFGHEASGAAPALATNGIDTMGAGDAVLAVAAPLVAAGLDLEAAAFVGNVVGAIKVSIVGHRRHVGRQEIVDKVEELLG